MIEFATVYNSITGRKLRPTAGNLAALPGGGLVFHFQNRLSSGIVWVHIKTDNDFNLQVRRELYQIS